MLDAFAIKIPSSLTASSPCVPAAVRPALPHGAASACLFNFRSVSGDVFQGGGGAIKRNCLFLLCRVYVMWKCPLSRGASLISLLRKLVRKFIFSPFQSVRNEADKKMTY